LQDQQEIPLWPGIAPGSGAVKLVEKLVDRSRDAARPDQHGDPGRVPKPSRDATQPAKPAGSARDRYVTGISRPSLTAYLPDKPNGASLIVAPGGGYVREVIDKEGIEVARHFAAKGLTVFVLKYRLPCEGHAKATDVPLQDAQRAVRSVRANAAAWKLAPARIGILGFSAAGHLASTLATRFGAKAYEPIDQVDALSARPDFVILMYPVISMEDGVAHAGSRTALLGARPAPALIAEHSTDLHVSADGPPTLLMLAGDDTSVPPENSLRYYQALRRASVPAELHVYAKGGHGFAMRLPADAPAAAWPDTAWAWMTSLGMIGK
jgi:acetyl esterase/lipase